MGTMPFHLEKGVMGLRFDYLARDPRIRYDNLIRLLAGEDPFRVATTTRVPAAVSGRRIEAHTGRRHRHQCHRRLRVVFGKKLDLLLSGNSYRYDHHEGRSSKEYQADEKRLAPRNRDTPKNRAAFMGYLTWAKGQYPLLVHDMRQALIAVLGSSRPRLDHWDCSLPDNTAPTVYTCLDASTVARVFFCTDHGPVESRDDLPSR